MGDTAFKNDFTDLDEEAEDLAGSFELKPIAPTQAAVDEIKKRIEVADEVSKKQGFSEPKQRKKKVRRSRYYETGRSEPISLKGRKDDSVRLSSICNKQDWVKGQALQYALDALQEKLTNPDDPFWMERNFKGVD